MNIRFEEMRERHARFLRIGENLPALRALAFPSVAVKVKAEKVPHEVPYLRELAIALEEHGDNPGALAAWEQVQTLWTKDRDAQSEDDTLARALLLEKQGNKPRALEALRTISHGAAWSIAARKALPLHARLAAEAGLWDEVRTLMNAVTASGVRDGVPQIDACIALAEILAQHQRHIEAQSLLVRAERATQDNTERFKLRLAQLKQAAREPSWSPRSGAALISTLLNTPCSDADALKSFTNWLKGECTSPRAGAWADELRRRAPLKTTSALALCAFSPSLREDDLPLLQQAWASDPDSRHAAHLLAVQILREAGSPQWALDVSRAGNHPAVMRSPEVIRTLSSLGDLHSVEEHFARMVRLSFPGGSQTVELAQALADGGHAQMADELFALGIARMHDTASYHPRLITAYARFLIARQRFEQAESLLLKDGGDMVSDLADLLAELYAAWGRAGRMAQELVKFDLADGVQARAAFLASQKARP